ncbi:hypothetical protein ACDQ55_15550 [Chitinophaga sp. 30R24]|uniref:hypothetical protein n=1 Tax=Chitinophaga sp. 30R24 TaxID=3248838 RepID=UPI003B9158BA
MKKILLAIDGENFPEGAFEFVCKMNEHEPVLLSGVFLPQLIAGNIRYTSVFVPLIENYSTTAMEQSITIFKESCQRNNITFTVHNNLHDFALVELKKETRFADLLLLGSEKFYSNLNPNGPNKFLQDALHKTECPVIAAPEKFTFPENVVLTYDGSASSAYAIKYFTYIFPQLCNKPTILVFNNVKKTKDIPEFDEIRELATYYFTNLTIQLLNADPKKYFGTWLSDIKNPIVVSGAYGRSNISRAFKHSFISEIINEHKVPLFIAHH